MRRTLCLIFLMSALGAPGCAAEESDSSLGSTELPHGLCWSPPCDDGGTGPGGPSNETVPQITVLGEYTAKGMRAPSRLAVMSTGDIVVTDVRTGQVFVLNPFGQTRTVITALRQPTGVAVGPQDRIYVGDRATRSVTIFSAVGEVQGVFGQGAGEFQLPADLDYDPAQQVVYVVDTRADQVLTYRTDGRLRGAIGGQGDGDGQFRSPTALHFDPAGGLLYVADDGHSRVQVFDRSGNFVRAFGAYGSSAGKFTRLQGMTLDRAGRLYVADTYQGRLQVVDRKGLPISYVGDYGSGPRMLKTVTDAVMDGDGRLIVASYGTGRIVVFGVDNYSDPTPRVDATVWFDPAVFNVFSRSDWVNVTMELPDGRANDVDPTSIRVQDLLADTSAGVEFGDDDANGVPDVSVRVSRAALLKRLDGGGNHVLLVTGELTTGERAEGRGVVEVVEQGGR